MNFYCVGKLDGEGEDDKRNAKLCHTINRNLMNMVRMMGYKVGEEFYKQEEDFMPAHNRKERRHQFQSWDEMKSNLGTSLEFRRRRK